MTVVWFLNWIGNILWSKIFNLLPTLGSIEVFFSPLFPVVLLGQFFLAQRMNDFIRVVRTTPTTTMDDLSESLVKEGICFTLSLTIPAFDDQFLSLSIVEFSLLPIIEDDQQT